MDERIDIVDENGQFTGESALKSEIHRRGLYHNTAHVWLYTPEGCVLLAQRSASKLICPLLWDVSVAGHVDAGESITDAAIREIHEELGVKISKDALVEIGINKSMRSYPNGMIDNEFHHSFISEVNFKISDYEINTEEVETIKYVTLSEFENFLDQSEATNHFVKSNAPYYQFVLSHIKRVIKNKDN